MPEDTKRKLPGGKAGKFLVAVFVIAFTVVLVLIVAKAVNESFSSGVPEEVENAVSATEKDIAYTVDSDSVISMRAFGNGVVLLTDTAVTYLSENGEISADDTHTFTSPAMNVCDSRLIIYSRLSEGVRTEKNCKVMKEMTASSALLTCAMGKKGNYAVCTLNDNGYASRLKVYDSENKQVFEWGCAADYITSAALSENGKYIAVTVMGASQAESYSKVFLFDFAYGTEKYSVTIPAAAAYAVSFADKKNVLVSADNGVHKIDFEGNDTVLLSCLSGQMERSDICSGGLSAFCVSGGAENAGSTLHIFNKKCAEIGSAALSGTVLSVSCSEKYVAVAFNDRVELYDSQGRLCRKMTTDLSCVSAVAEDKYLFVLCVNGIVISPIN